MAKTGKDNKSNIAVMKTDQTNNGNWLNSRPLARMLTIVTIKLIAPAIDDAPAKCKPKIPRSTEGPE
jgi:hypothetical protein